MQNSTNNTSKEPHLPSYIRAQPGVFSLSVSHRHASNLSLLTPLRRTLLLIRHAFPLYLKCPCLPYHPRLTTLTARLPPLLISWQRRNTRLIISNLTNLLHRLRHPARPLVFSSRARAVAVAVAGGRIIAATDGGKVERAFDVGLPLAAQVVGADEAGVHGFEEGFQVEGAEGGKGETLDHLRADGDGPDGEGGISGGEVAVPVDEFGDGGGADAEVLLDFRGMDRIVGKLT